MSDLDIRPTIPADLDALADVLVEVHAADGYPVEGVDDPRAWLSLSDPVGQWTALVDGRPVGHVAIVPLPKESEAPDLLRALEYGAIGPVGVLVRLFVAPAARGASIGHELMEVAERQARALGLGLTMEVMEKDQDALRLYERRGWRRIGTFEHFYDRDLSVRAVALVAPLDAPPTP